jgi:hypothetical protein
MFFEFIQLKSISESQKSEVAFFPTFKFRHPLTSQSHPSSRFHHQFPSSSLDVQALKHGPIKIRHLKFNHKTAHKPTFSLTIIQARAKRSALITTQCRESSLLLNHVMSCHGTIDRMFRMQDLQNKLTKNVLVKAKLLHKLLLNLVFSSKSTVN